MKQHVEAEKDLNLALEISPNNPGHYFNLAKFYLLTDVNQNAKECFEGGVATFSKKGEAFYREKFTFAEDKINLYIMVCDEYNKLQKEIKLLQEQPPT